MTLLPPTRLWGVDAPLVPLTGGHRNRAFRTTGVAQDLVFKSTRRSPEALAWLTPVHACARAAGITVPGLIASRNGALSEQGWTCESFLTGRAFTAADLATLAPRLRTFHHATSNLPQRPGFLSSRDLLSKDCGGDVDLSLMPPALALACRAAWAALGREETVVHADLSPGNILHGPDGQFILLDWDESRRDLAGFDLAQLGPSDAATRRAALAWEVACCWQIEPAQARALARRLTGPA
jgi:Ser/Thr protein kinase RdoA (MazF antagonist)